MPDNLPSSPAHPSPALIPGQRLDGRYLIGALLGRGGMGVVYRAKDEQTGQPVAIKTILSTTGGEQARRFRREFRALTRLQHPHIIAVHDFGQANGTPYYVMEYIDGPDLAQLLNERGAPLNVAETVTIGIQVSQALAYIHNQGIIHRDIKPSNIMVLPSSSAAFLHVKLMDFGLIKMVDVSARITTSGQWMGTLQYLSPEQVRGGAVDRRTDLYALGLVLYELCTGSLPFRGPDFLSIALQRLIRPPIPPRELRPDLPPTLCEIVLKLLAHDVNGRYASAEELLTELAPLAESNVVLAPAPPPRADIVAQSPLVGRDDELNQLADWLEAAWDGPGKFVLVEGEAGVGKTRLVRELAGLVRQRGRRRLQGGCYEEERLPYGPFAEALRDAIRGSEDRLAPILEGLRPELARLVPGLTLPPGEKMPDLEPEQARLRLVDAVTRFLVRLSKQRPIILILDDLQWADEGTLELLHYLVRNSQESPIFICGTARQDELQEGHPLVTLLQTMSRRGLVERLPLERLSSEAVADLVAGMLAGGPPPTQLAERLYREAEGNAFFVEEMLKAWVEEGRLVWKGGQWSLISDDGTGGVSALSIPASVADVVARRLQGVSGVGREVIALAAVLGYEFNFEVLLRMTPDMDEDTLLDAIEDLLRARLLEEADHPREDRYRFAHNKIQEVVYARAASSRRRLRQLHRDAGRALEQVYAGQLERVIEPLARHFLEAGDRRGVDYGLQAGDAARAVYANQGALDYYGRALALAEELQKQETDGELVEQIIALCYGIGDVHLLIGEYSAAIECFQAVLEQLPEAKLEAGERRQRSAATHRRLAHVYEAQSHYEEAMAELHAALAALQVTTGASQELALIYRGIGWLQMRRGNYREAIVSCDKGLRAVPPGHHAAVAELYDTLGFIYKPLGEYGRAVTYHQRSLALREQINDQAGIAKTCNYLAVVSRHQSNYEQAIAYSQHSLAISEKIGQIAAVATLYNNLGAIYRDLKQYDQAIDFYQRALPIHERVGDQLGIAMVLGNLGEVYMDKGDLTQAVEYLQSALSKSDEIGDREGVTIAYHLLAEIYLAQGNLARAVRLGQQALEVADNMGARPYQANAHQVLGQAHLTLDQPDQAYTHLEAAWRIFSSLGDEEEATATKAALRALDKKSEEREK